VASPISLVVSWRSPRPHLIVNAVVFNLKVANKWWWWWWWWQFRIVTQRDVRQTAKVSILTICRSRKHLSIALYHEKLNELTWSTCCQTRWKMSAQFACATKRTLEWVIYKVKGYLNTRWRLVELNSYM